ncbi:hypothetical protein BDV25DRAFT_169242 [Aspergillus avenaceus]|uniref:Galactose oxidase n=1 Tax=Aspergillus avenaceus TaxID=36643 RepID=A0A5N6TME8_ASPAV|nr:hypothetical protein BDV25DRAFT_169242 [Aspergillus avenaceus]
MDDCLPRSSQRRRTVGVNLALAVVLLLVAPVLSAVPYTTSHLLYSTQDNGNNATEFLSLNISNIMDISDTQYTTLSNNAPFQLNYHQTALVPAIDQHGVIKIYTGDCQNTSEYGALWRFTPDTESSVGNGTWDKLGINGTRLSEPSLHGPNYFAAGFAYAPSNTTNSSLFAFGGLCPFSNGSETAWFSAANYSQSMVALEPPKPDSISTYAISTIGDRAPPIPEAGFTITPLQPTYRISSGNQLLQQQDFLLIGGHTQDAWLNMSQLAVFSLPQSSWSFITVDFTKDWSRTELAKRETPVVEPRSGHTAVLSPDGDKIIIFGGWVGNTSVPASPQLAILELGADYTGSAAWTWRVPSTKETGMAEGTGIFGHGAAMLPGGVMMITGGYKISQSSKRSAAGFHLNSQAYLYNVTAGAWVTSYTNPNTQDPGALSKADNESAAWKSRKAGLGAGLGLGIPFVVGTVVFLWFYCRRRRVRKSRDQELRELALGAERDHFWGGDESNLTSSVRGPSADASTDYPWSNNRGFGRPTNWRDNPEMMAERTGLLTDIPSPSKGGRPQLSARLYRPPAQHNEYRNSDGTGEIHPIDEREEEETQNVGRGQSNVTEPSRESAFLHPQSPIGNEPFPERAATRAANIGLESDGRSPGQDDRTGSNLSDSSRSAKSGYHARGTPNNHSGPPSTDYKTPDLTSSASSQNRETRSRPDSAILIQDKRYSSDSYSTANTTLSQRQAEGEHLLRDDPEVSSPNELVPRPLSISKSRASGWVGNVRRVLSVTRKRPPTAEDTNTSSTASGIDRKGNAPGSAGAISDDLETRLPRRSVSASAELFRRKQGARDWSAGNIVSRELTGRSFRDDFGLDGLLDLEEEDWDVEGAAENRRVQMTFTVPKEKLRVVNASDMDNISEDSVSRSNSRT